MNSTGQGRDSGEGKEDLVDLETWVNVFQKKVGGFGGFYGVWY